MKPAILFDLGNTPVGYYRADQLEPILRVAIAGFLRELTGRGLAGVTLDEAPSRAIAENREAADCRFTPMAERCERIFGVPPGDDALLARGLSEIFLSPIFERAAAAVKRQSAECVFVGDDLRRDVAGSRAAGMRPILVDRERREPGHPGERIEDLNRLLEMVDTGA